MAHCLFYQDVYLYLTSNYCNDNRINKTANCVSSSVDFLVWHRGGNTRMGLFGGSIRLVPNRSFLPLSNNRQLYRVSIGCLVHAAAAASVHHTYVGEDRRILVSPCTGLSTDRSPFSFALCRHPFCLSRFEIDVVSRVTLPAWPGQGYGRHWLFFRALSSICLLSVLGRCIDLKVIWIFELYICILDSLSHCCIYVFVGSIEDYCVMILLR